MNNYQLNELKNNIKNSESIECISTYLIQEEKQLIREECFVSNLQLYDEISNNDIQYLTEYKEKIIVKYIKDL